MTASGRPAPLAGVRVIEISAFVAAPLGSMTLAQLGADVIRIDPIGGNIDYTRWPITDEGRSIYWASLNKGKRSVTLNLKSPEGQALATQLIADAGTVVTNLPAHGWLSYENLVQHRPDLVMLRLTGTHTGGPAVDYTVNAASGFPVITGHDEKPVNHALPAWDVIAGVYIANGVLAAELERRTSGTGQEVNLALSDVMLATVGNLGYVAEIQTKGSTRGPLGNGLYGAYGQSFRTADDREVMVAVISNRHWSSLGKATGLAEKLAMIGPLLDIDLSTEGGRYEAREAIDAVLRPWFAARTAAEAAERLAAAGVLQGVFQTFEQLVNDDPACSTENPLFTEIDQPGVGRVLAPRVPLSFAASPVADAQPAPSLGENTDDVLQSVLGVDADRIAQLRADGVLAP
ncbi:CoA transferase [Microbacterium sp. No. 7]|uniref:CoA transferase n=1 Tax=Microbacterium sp. No. 7 TaxID=1714373 RepID=UPI0006CFAA77|nr:CoA transferase [Microbacterium sp. No. 7]ALJ19242.1 dehydratase [Microbacterium sp. No. 7]